MSDQTEHDEEKSSGSGGETEGSGTRATAKEIYENVRVAAEEELERPNQTLFWSAFAAGLTIAFSFLCAAFLSSIASPAHKHLAAAIGYPVGFVFVVLARNQLFTENTLQPIIPLLHSPSRETLSKVMSLWGVVYAGNLIGALVIGVVLAKTSMVPHTLREDLAAISGEAVQGGFWHVAFLAIFAGWLVALMAWLMGSTHSTGAQFALIWLTTAPISALGFRHSIAGAVEAIYSAASGFSAWSTAVFGFIVPATLGNIVGGVTLVAVLNHGQVAAEQQEA